MQKQLESGKQPEYVEIDTRLSDCKSLHVKWITSFYDIMQNNKQIVLNIWERSDIANFFQIEQGVVNYLN